MVKVSSMYLPQEMVEPTMIRVLQMVIQLAFTPFLLVQLTHLVGKPIMMSNVHARWPSHSATTVRRSPEQTTLGMPTIKW